MSSSKRLQPIRPNAPPSRKPRTKGRGRSRKKRNGVRPASSTEPQMDVPTDNDLLGVLYPGPGPAGYKPANHTSIGNQPQSTRATSPRPVIGTSARGGRPIRKENIIPGPGAYKKKGFLGTQYDSERVTAPLFSVRGREKFGSTVDGESGSFPGPGAYKTADIKKGHSKHRNGPKFSFAASTIDHKVHSSTPGPGTYKSVSSLGKQLLSQNPKACIYSFARARKAALSNNEEDGGGGGGDSSYAKVNAIGKQPQSTRPSLPAWRFGTSTRTTKRQNRYPGPGSYRNTNAIGKQKLSHKPTAPSCSMAGRERFGSPWYTRR